MYLFSHTRTHRARDEAALSEDFLSPPTHTNTSVLIQRVSGQIRALCDTPLGYPNDGILPLLHFDAKYDSSHVESLIRLLYRGVLRWMSDLRERLRICSLAQLYTTRDSDLFSHTRTHRARDEAALSEDFLSFFSSLALRADSAGSLCLADRRYDGPQPVCLVFLLHTAS